MAYMIHALVKVVWLTLFTILAHSNTINHNYTLPASHLNVTQTRVPCKTTDADLEQLYKENLGPDIAVWKGQGLSMQSLKNLLEKFPERDTRRLVLFYNGQVYLPLAPDPRVCGRPCNHLMHDTMAAFKTWNRTVPMPNALILLNVHDDQQCQTMGPACPAPIFSIAKVLSHRDSAKFPTSPDILIPKLSTRKRATFTTFPWELKSNKAFWRGSWRCDHSQERKSEVWHVHCSRYHTREVIEKYDAAKQLFDYGYTVGIPGITPISPYVPARDFARFKFLLNLDGYTAAYRLAKLLLMNSVVLKEASPKGEYFYRSLREYEHYLPIYKDNETDILDVLKEYRKPERDADLKRISASANAFSARYCCPQSRMLYWRRVLTEYKKLFQGQEMEEAIERVWWPLVRDKVQQIGPLCKTGWRGELVPCSQQARKGQLHRHSRRAA